MGAITDNCPRIEIIEELARRYGSGGTLMHLRFLHKKYAWLLVVGGARAVKRFIDIAASLVLLLGLAPLFAIVALLIKATDGGPVFFEPSV